MTVVSNSHDILNEKLKSILGNAPNFNYASKASADVALQHELLTIEEYRNNGEAIPEIKASIDSLMGAAPTGPSKKPDWNPNFPGPRPQI